MEKHHFTSHFKDLVIIDLKAFKYFDLNNNGTVEPDEFAKAVEKIGIMIPTRQVSERFNSLIEGSRWRSSCRFLLLFNR